MFLYFYEDKQLGLWAKLGCVTRVFKYVFVSFSTTGSKRDAEDRIVPRHEDADDSDVDVKSDDERLLHK